MKARLYPTEQSGQLQCSFLVIQLIFVSLPHLMLWVDTAHDCHMIFIFKIRELCICMESLECSLSYLYVF